MNKRKLATLVAASFAGLMLSSPSFATHADKAQTTSGGSTSAQTTASASDAPESRSIERADKKAIGPQESHRTGTSKPSKPDASDKRATERAEDKAVASAEAKTDAEKADKSDASSNTATKNQTDSNTSRKTGAPESRSAERADKRTAVSKEDAAAAKADYKAAIQKCEALPSGQRGSCVQDAEDAQSLVMNNGRDGSPKSSAPESRIGPRSAK